MRGKPGKSGGTGGTIAVSATLDRYGVRIVCVRPGLRQRCPYQMAIPPIGRWLALAAATVTLALPAPAAAQEAFQIDFNLKLQADWRASAFAVRRARVGVEGTVLTFVEYQVERDLVDDVRPWRDVYVNAKVFTALQVQAGQFKVPFSAEQLTGSTKLAFVHRSLAASYLAPGRELGVMVHGAMANGAVKYQGAIVRDHARNETAAGRLSIRPWHKRRVSAALRGIRAGAALTRGAVPEGLNSLRGRTVADERLFHPVMVRGLRHRVGLELEWIHGPLSLQSEMLRVADQRQGQSTDDGDLPPVVARGWYVSGAWRVSDRLPARLGALEIAARVEDVRFGGASDGTPGSVSIRAAHVLERADRVITGGISWAPTRGTRLQVNLIRERRREGGVGIGAAGWSPVVRAQVSL